MLLTDHHCEPSVNFTGDSSLNGSSLGARDQNSRESLRMIRPVRFCCRWKEKCLVVNLLRNGFVRVVKSTSLASIYSKSLAANSFSFTSLTIGKDNSLSNVRRVELSASA